MTVTNSKSPGRQPRASLDLTLTALQGQKRNYSMEKIIVTNTDVKQEIDPRPDNFVQAYLDIDYPLDEARIQGALRLQEDEAGMFPVRGCTDLATAKEVIWLIEAAEVLNSGFFENDVAIDLIEKALASLKK